MCDGAEIKDALYSYISAVGRQAGAVRLNYINSQVVPLDCRVSDLPARLNPAAFAAAGGNMANSDFKSILRRVFAAAGKRTVAMFVSDCLLDIPQGAAADYLGITRTDIANIADDRLRAVPDLGVCIWQLSSTFSGTYYYPGGGHTSYTGRRPYYIWLIGPRQALAWLLRTAPDSKIQHGTDNYAAFAPSGAIPCALFSGGAAKGGMRLPHARGDRAKVKLMADLALTLQSDKTLARTDIYTPTQGKAQVTAVAAKPAADGYSHLVELSVADAVFAETIRIRPAKVPAWVEKAGKTRPGAVEQGKTFSIQYIIGGVADAYDRYQDAGTLSLGTNKH